MWHQRNSLNSLNSLPPDEFNSNFNSPNISTSSNDYPSSTTFIDSENEKSPFFYNHNNSSHDKNKWKPKSNFLLKLNKFFKLNSKLNYLKLLLCKILFNKKSISILILSITFLLSIKQIYYPLTYFCPPSNWSYLEINKYDFLSDSKIVKLVNFISKNENLHKNYYYDNSNNNNNNYFDRRITPALYLNTLLNNFNGYEFDDSQTFEFSWIDWINFDERLLPNIDYLLSHNGLPILNCKQFEIEIGFPKDNIFKNDYLLNCENLNNLEISNLFNLNYPHFKIMKPLDNFNLPIDSRILMGATYLYHNFQSPNRLIFIDGLNEINLIIPISNKESFKNPIFKSDLNSLNSLQSIDDLMNNLITQLLNNNSNEIFNKDSIYEISKINKNLNPISNNNLKLTKFDFFNPSNLLEIQNYLKNFNIENSLDFKLYSNIINEINNYPHLNFSKYFHEPRLNNKKIGGSHYDWRFFNIKEIDNEYKRISNLNRLIRAWLRFTNNENIQTWISHGTLLGYSFNKFMLPWDFDHDVQISSSSMWKLAKHFNQSLIIDCTIDDEFSSGYGQYLLDISSNFFNRNNSNGLNSIDARFIDIHTGIYIDITQLSFVENKEILFKQEFKKIDKVLKNEFFRLLKQNKININEVINNNDNDLVGDKNYHFYKFNEINEFKKCLFEGEFAYLPTKYTTILDREFPNRKTSWRHEGYTWRSDLSMWVYNNRCNRFDYKGTSCLKDEYVQMMKDLMFKNNESNNDDNVEIGSIHDIDQRRGVFPDWEAVAAVEVDNSQIGN